MQALRKELQAARGNDGEAGKEEKNLYEEMRRVARIVLLAMRSKRGLVATMQDEG